MFHSTLLSLTVAIACGAVHSFAQGDPKPPPQDQLLATLRSDAELADKRNAAAQLARRATRDAVPALAAMLADEQLHSLARGVLELLPDAAADDAFRGALATLKGAQLIGVINSIGVRRDEKAVAALTKLLQDADPGVASAAAVSLGKIGAAEVAPALEKAMADASPALLPAIQDACLRCAEASLAKNNAPAAIALYDRLRTSQAPRHVRMAATRGAIIARGTAGVALLAEQLQSSDDGMFTVALQLANERPGPEVTKAVASALAGLSAEKQCLVLPALGQRRDHAALPAVLAAARNGPPNVRVAAISALTQIGDPGALPALTESATNPDQEVSTAARNSLASFPAREADAAIQAMLNAPNAKVRVVAAELTGQRRLTAAVPALLKAADDAEQPVRLASLKALGELAGPAELPALLSLLLNAKSLQDSHAAEGALAALCARQAAPAACAGKIVPGLGQARGATQVALLRVLRAVGGAEACAAVRAAADAGDAEVKETALRVLCDWPTPDALPDLTRMAKTSTDPKFKLLALRGCLRLIPLQDAPDDRKLASLQETLPLVERDEEKRLAIAALGQIAAADSLALLAPHFDNPNLKEEAGVAAVAVAERIVASHPAAVVTAMQKAAAATSNTRLANRARALLRQARAAVAPQRKK